MRIRNELRRRFADALARALGDEHRDTDPLIRTAGNPQFGDFQANVAMSLGKRLGRKPREVAEQVADALDADDLLVEPPAIAGPGFINLRLSDACLVRELMAMAGDDRLGVAPAARPETVVLDYSAPNVAKGMHVGHLRSTILGDALARVLGFLGHGVRRQNHLGDWGTQFGMLIEHMVDAGWTEPGDHAVADLNAMYQAAKRKFDADPEFQKRSRLRVVRLQGGDADTLALWRALIDESKRHFAEIYHRLGVLLTDADIAGESLYNRWLADVVSELEAAGLAVPSEGALCIFPDGFQDKDGKPLPFLIRKGDGGYLYATTDLAAVRYRLRELGATRLIYVTDARQRQHFAMLFAVVRATGWAGAEVRLEHVPFGMILGGDNKPFKTRTGGTVRLRDLLDEAVERARAIIDEKDNQHLDADARQAVAEAIGIGAVKYGDLSNDRVKDYVFAWQRMLSFTGNTAPYLQNAYVRVRSIFRRARERGIATDLAGAALQLDEPNERALALRLLQFSDAVTGVASSLEPHHLCTYLYELASELHQFYQACPVLPAEDDVRRSRLLLSDLVARTLKQGLELLGIDVVERM